MRQAPASDPPSSVVDSLIGKEIRKAKLLVTDRCNLGCPYCYVSDRGRDMSWPVARNAVELLLRSGGEDKLISLFGGEPLLNFGLIERIAPYARKRAEALGKKLVLSMITSASILKPSHLSFLREQRVRVAVSLGGVREDHDAYRLFRGGGGSYESARRILPALFEALGPEKAGVSFCVLPSTVERLRRNFLHLLSLGFRYFNFEIIQDFEPWTPGHAEIFLEQAERLLRDCLEGVEGGDPIYVNSVNWELARKRLSASLGVQCPFNYLLRVYPGGELVFSHSAMNDSDGQRYVFGNLASGELRSYGRCAFDADAADCRSCVIDYFAGRRFDRGASLIHGALQQLSLKMAEHVLRRAPTDRRYRRYAEKTREDVLF
ncbi:MAG: radical SAM protein [Elusimicrobia bacterium]|nr:radical SAM protein [Elusimicrobiota bacterium]MDE2424992.1 radical SAM protein [Elusimicrobiota bacterium]